MKKIFTLLALGALAACAKVETEAPSTPAPLVDPEGVTIFHAGSFATTRMTLGNPEDGRCKVLWEQLDSLTVLNAEDGTVLGKAGIVKGAGEALADFAMPGTIADSTLVKLVYGELAIPAEQARASVSDKALISSAVSEPIYVYKGESQAFVMKHQEAVVKVSVTASADFNGALLSAVILRSEGPSVADGSDYVRLSLTTPVAISASDPTEIWFSTLPCEPGASPLYVAFELVSKDVHYTIPVAFENVKLSAGSVNPFKVEKLATYMNVPWFKSFDLREMPGIDFAYGDANCYFIQCKNGSTYKGATYTPNDKIPDEVAVSYRARGDFRKVIVPKDVTFTWMKLGATNPETGTGDGNVVTMRTIGFEDSGINPSLFSFSVDSEKYEVRVKNDGAYAGAPVLLMTKGGKVLWAWSFWNIAADGTEIDPVLITNGAGKQIITMDIGQATRDGETWGQMTSSISAAPVSGHDQLYRTVFRYQWGRPIPVLWNSVTTLDIPGVQEGNIPAIVGPVSLEESMLHPASLIVASAESGATITDWLSTPNADLWGNNSTSLASIGTKTVFDPCPKGYRVCDRYTLLNIVRNYASDWAIVSGDGYAFHNVNYKAGGSDRWLRSGFLKATTITSLGKTAIGGNAGGAGGTNGFWWTNLCEGPNDVCPSVYVAATNANLAFNDNWNAANRAYVASVRCELDVSNK